MSVDPRGDATSLGSILLEWGVITEDQLSEALEQQKSLRGDDLLGKLLVANGVCSEDEVDTAMSAQASMRSVSKTKKAMAVADVALARRRRTSVLARREQLIQKARQVERSITGEGHVAVGPMLAKSD
jgi:hypothetical protein